MRDSSSRIIKQIWNRNSLVSVRRERSSSSSLNVDVDLLDDRTRNVFMSLEIFKGEALLSKEIPSVGNSRLRLPSRANLSLDEHQSGSFFSSFHLQSTLELLASFASSSLNTNLSRLISLILLNSEGHAIPLLTNVDHLCKIIIPRDPSLIVPQMSLVNFTGERRFHFHSFDFNLSYVFIHRLDRGPILNSSQPKIDR